MDFKKTALVSSLFIIFLLCSCSNSTPKETVDNNDEFKKIVEQKEMDIYEEYVSALKKIGSSEYMNWKNDPNAVKNERYIYFGRSTCPDCRKFISDTVNIDKMDNIVYIDTSLLSKSEINKMKIKEVPSVIHFSPSGKSSLITIEEFQNIVKELHPY